MDLILVLKMNVVWAFLLTSLIGIAAAQKLLLVHAVWNQGGHTALKKLPAFKEPPEMAGSAFLTETGKRESFNLGASFFIRYVRKLGFLNEKRLREQAYVYSSDVNLTLTTAYAVMAGMVRNNMSRETDFQNWRPFPVHSDPNDNKLRWDVPCPEAESAARFRLFSAPWFVNKNNLVFLRQMTKKLGMQELKDFSQIYIMVDAMRSAKAVNLEWPVGITDSSYRMLEGLADAAAAISYSDHTVAKLRGGRLLMDVLDRINMIVKCSSRQVTKDRCESLETTKFYGYSTDDLTLHALSAALGATNSFLPQSASAIAIELWQTSRGTYEIRAQLKSRENRDQFKNLLIGGCPDLMCPLDHFNRRSQPYISKNWRMECRLDQSSSRRWDKVDTSVDCLYEVDRSSTNNCYDWAVAGYCRKNLPVRHIFCRYTCNCNRKFTKYAN